MSFREYPLPPQWNISTNTDSIRSRSRLHPSTNMSRNHTHTHTPEWRESSSDRTLRRPRHSYNACREWCPRCGPGRLHPSVLAADCALWRVNSERSCSRPSGISSRRRVGRSTWRWRWSGSWPGSERSWRTVARPWQCHQTQKDSRSLGDLWSSFGFHCPGQARWTLSHLVKLSCPNVLPNAQRKPFPGVVQQLIFTITLCIVLLTLLSCSFKFPRALNLHKACVVIISFSTP